MIKGDRIDATPGFYTYDASKIRVGEIPPGLVGMPVEFQGEYIFYKYNFLVLFSYLFYGVYEEQKFCKNTDFNLGVVLDRIVFDIFKVQFD